MASGTDNSAMRVPFLRDNEETWPRVAAPLPLSPSPPSTTAGRPKSLATRSECSGEVCPSFTWTAEGTPSRKDLSMLSSSAEVQVLDLPWESVWLPDLKTSTPLMVFSLASVNMLEIKRLFSSGSERWTMDPEAAICSAFSDGYLPVTFLWSAAQNPSGLSLSWF